MYLSPPLKTMTMWRFFLIIICIPLLSSCFELREELYLHKEGWGSYKILVDFSESKEMLQDLAAKTDTSKHNPFGKPNETFAELAQTWGLGAEKLNKINGISNAEQVYDEKNYILGLQFEFQDISALNLALTLKDGGEFNPKFELPYIYQKGKLAKNNIFIFQKLLKYLDISINEEMDISKQKKAIFAQISYKTAIKTSGKIKKYNNYSYVMQENGREVHGTFKLKDVLNGNADISTLIKFK